MRKRRLKRRTTRKRLTRGSRIRRRRSPAAPPGILTLALDPDAVSKSLTTTLRNISIPPMPFAPQTNRSLIVAQGAVSVDLSSAFVTYYAGVPVVGGVQLLIHFDQLFAQIFWNDVFGIPKNACVQLADVCGHVFEVCWDIDLGVWELPLPFQDLHLPVFISLQNLWFKTETDKYELFAEPGLDLIAQVLAELPGVLADGLINYVKQTIRHFLEGILGTGALAELFIDFILAVWNLVDLVIQLADTVVGMTWEAVAEPIATVIQQLVDAAFKTHVVEVDLQQSLPKLITLSPAYSDTDSAGHTYQHAAVTVALADAPSVGVVGGLEVTAEV